MEALEQLVTTSELAEIIGTSKQVVANTVKKLDKVLCPVARNNQGGYLFNQKQATLIKQEIQGHHNLKSRQIDNVSTELEENETILQAQRILVSRINNLKNQLAEQQPKVEYYDDLCNSTGFTKIGDIGKQLKIGSNNIFKKLCEDKILYRKYENDTYHYVPYYQYEKYFRMKQSSYTTSDGEKHATWTLELNQKGVMWLTNKYKSIIKEA